MQAGPEWCILQCPITSKFEEIFKVSVEPNSLRVHVPLFWIRSSTPGVYKVTENCNLTLENMMIWTIWWFLISRDIIIHLLQNSGFIISRKTSAWHSCQKIVFMGLEMDWIKMTLSFITERYQKLSNLSGASQESFYNSFGIDQSKRSTLIHLFWQWNLSKLNQDSLSIDRLSVQGKKWAI